MFGRTSAWFWAHLGEHPLVKHPMLTSLNIERINLGESGAGSLAAAILRVLPLDGVPGDEHSIQNDESCV